MVDNAVADLTNYVHQETNKVNIETDAKVVEIHNEISDVNEKVTNTNTELAIHKLDNDKAFEKVRYDFSKELSTLDSSLTKAFGKEFEKFSDEYKEEMGKVKYDVERHKIDVTNTVNDFTQNIHNDIARFDASIRICVKEKTANHETKIAGEISELRTEMKKQDSSIVSYIDSKDSA